MKVYKFQISQEELVSRLFGVFPYIEEDGMGVVRLHKASDSPMGCYGKIVPNLTIPCGCEETDLDISLAEGGSYSYRTLMNAYYTLKKNSVSNEFTSFIDGGIGKKYLSDYGCDESFFKEYPLAPEYVFVATLPFEINSLKQLKNRVELYERRLELNPNDTSVKMCCEKEKYEMMGGETLLAKLETILSDNEGLFDDYYNFASGIDDEKLNFGIQLVNTYKDMGVVTPAISEWIAGKTYYVDDVVYHNGIIFKCKEETSGAYDEETEEITLDEDKWGVVYFDWTTDVNSVCDDVDAIKCGKCASQLKSIRRNETYANEYDENETPDEHKDWLWYYRVGQPKNIQCVYDELGNVCVLSIDGNRVNADAIGQDEDNLWDGTEEDGGYVINLAAWGDVITSITAEDGVVTVEYYIGCHLKAKKDSYEIDDDNNIKYFLTDFQIDTDSDYGKFCGVKYTDKYTYDIDSTETDSIAKLLEDGEFNKYINGEFDRKISKDGSATKSVEKYEMDGSSYIRTYQIVANNNIIDVDCISSDFEYKRDRTNEDFETAPNIRYDYNVGVSTRPTVNDDVNISRGVTQGLEKHIKFSEIKTFEDLENYANGGFFTMSEENITVG